jgi:cupin fold WbuC family metalloprotein
MISVHRESDEVLYPDHDIVLVREEDMEELKRLALQNIRQRIRLCAHSAPDDRLHEMFIVHTKECYVRPHKHLGKAESMAILEGEVDVVHFAEDGSILKLVRMGPPRSGKVFYQRLSTSVYHMLLIRTQYLVFHEITEGPFLREKTVFPSWAPAAQGEESKRFMDRVDQMLTEAGHAHT